MLDRIPGLSRRSPRQTLDAPPSDFPSGNGNYDKKELIGPTWEGPLEEYPGGPIAPPTEAPDPALPATDVQQSADNNGDAQPTTEPKKENDVTAPTGTTTDTAVATVEPNLRDWFTHKVNKIRERFKADDQSAEESDRKSERLTFVSVIAAMLIGFLLVVLVMEDYHQAQEDEAFDTGNTIGYANGLQVGASQERSRIQTEDSSLPGGAEDPFASDEVAEVIFSTICSVEVTYDGFRLMLSTNKEIYLTNEMVSELGYGNPQPYAYIMELWNSDGTLEGLSNVTDGYDPQGQSICVNRNNRANTTGTGSPR